MTLFFALFVAKLLDFPPIVSFILGLVKVRNKTGYPVAIGLAILSYAIIKSMRITDTRWNEVEFISIALGLILPCLTFFCGKFLRGDEKN